MSSNAAMFVPTYSFISAITPGVNTIITFTAAHDFTVGEIVSIRVSQQYGMVQLNNQQPIVLQVTTDSITVPIDSRNYTPFISSPTDPQALAMVVPSSSGIIPGAIPPQTSLIDVFDNVPVT